MIRHEATVERLPIAYELTTRATTEGRVEIVLHLFQEGICILTRTIHTVSRKDASYVLSRCRIGLADRGLSQFEDEDLGSTRPRKRAA